MFDLNKLAKEIQGLFIEDVKTDVEQTHLDLVLRSEDEKERATVRIKPQGASLKIERM